MVGHHVPCENLDSKKIGILFQFEPTELESNLRVQSHTVLILNQQICKFLEKILNISQLASLIKESSFVIANDTGPAHMAAHLNVKGLTLFGKHTTAYKVSIERKNFKAIEVSDLDNLSAEKVFERLSNSLF